VVGGTSPIIGYSSRLWHLGRTLVPEPDPEPLDLLVFGSSGSGSFHQQAKLKKKLDDLLSLKTDVNVPTVSTGNKQKIIKILIFCCHLESR
jgi:hypothetical protein